MGRCIGQLTVCVGLFSRIATMQRQSPKKSKKHFVVGLRQPMKRHGAFERSVSKRKKARRFQEETQRYFKFCSCLQNKHGPDGQLRTENLSTTTTTKAKRLLSFTQSKRSFPHVVSASSQRKTSGNLQATIVRSVDLYNHPTFTLLACCS